MDFKLLLIILMAFPSVLSINYAYLWKQNQRSKQPQVLSFQYEDIDSQKVFQRLNKLYTDKPMKILINKCKFNPLDIKKVLNYFEQLKICDFEIISSQIKVGDLKRLLKSLKKLKQLSRFSIDGMELVDLIDELGDLLAGKNIVELSVKDPNLFFDDSHVKLVEKLIKSNVKKFIFHSDRMSNEAVERIGIVLPKTRVQVLELFSYDASYRGAILLIRNLASSRITSITIRSYNIRLGELRDHIKEFHLEDYPTLIDLSVGSYDYAERKEVRKYLKRNKDLLNEAKSVIKMFRNKELEFSVKNRNKFIAFELFADTDVLWCQFKNGKFLRKQIENAMKDNFFKTVGVVDKQLISKDKSRKSIADLPPEMRREIARRLKVSDVKSDEV